MKTNRRYSRRRGVAGIVATVIMFSIIFTVGASYFIFEDSMNQQYITSLISRQNSINSVGSENLIITTVLSSANHLEFYANNTGGIGVNATIVLVYSSTGTPLVCVGKNLPGGVCTTQSSTFSVCPSYSACTSGYSTPSYVIYTVGKDGSLIDTGYTYTSGTVFVKMITARGGVFTGSYPSPIVLAVNNQINSQVAVSVGSLLINQASFRFYYGSAFSLGDGYITSGFDAFAIPGSTQMLFSMLITNEDPNGRGVTLNEGSLITLGGVPSNNNFYIINGISDSSPYTGGVGMTAYNPNAPITIAYKASTTIYFGASHAGTTQTINSQSSGSPLGVFLLMFGTYSDNSYYSQTIPFEATYTTPATITSATISGCAGTTYTANLQSNTWLSGPKVGYVPNPVTSAGTIITVGTPTTSQAQYKIPTGTAVGYYQIYLTDGLNAAYMQFHVTC